MYQEIKLGMEFELFSEKTNDSLFATIEKEVIIFIKKIQDSGKDVKPMILGAFILNDIPLKKGGKTNIWVEYNCKIFPSRGLLVDIHRAIIYDKIPDEVLDRYNDIKKMIFN